MKHGVLDNIAKETLFFAARNNPNPCVNFANAFFGSVPRHPILARALEQIVMNVQSRNYGVKPWAPTGPCVLGRAITDVGYIESKIGLFKGNDRYIWNGEVIVKHKCNECGKSQEWAKGNNYWTLWNEKQFYCEDAPLIFADERGWEEAALM